MTVNFARLPELLRRSPPKASVQGRSRTFHDFRRRGAAWIILRDWTFRSSGAASALLTTAASRPHSSVLQKDGFISKISVQLPPSPPTGIGPPCGPRWRFA